MRNEEREKERGYFMRGERMFEANYVCMYDLLSFIPSLDDPAKTIKQDTLEFPFAYPWNNKARHESGSPPFYSFPSWTIRSLVCSPRIAQE
jgi:myosin-crossreactive antigen